MQGYSVKITK